MTRSPSVRAPVPAGSHFKRHMERDTVVRLPDADGAGTVGWVRTLMQHGGRRGDECALLRDISAHHYPYTIFCECDNPDAGHPQHGRARHDAADLNALLSVLPPGAGGCAPAAPLASWAAWYAYRGVDPHSPVSLLLSFPLTVYHVLHLVGALDGAPAGARDNGAPDADARDAPPTLAVHYLGPAAREAALAPLFQELAALLPPAVRVLRLEMIGPNAPEQMTSRPMDFEGPDGARLELRWHRRLYDECGLAPPAAVVACNSGIFEYDEWQPTVAFIEEQGAPFYFTDYSESGLLAGALSIREAHGLELSLPATTNPFRQPFNRQLLVPPGSAGNLGVPWLGNGFLAGVLTRD